jgi:hypothetical protein
LYTKIPSLCSISSSVFNCPQGFSQQEEDLFHERFDLKVAVSLVNAALAAGARSTPRH